MKNDFVNTKKAYVSREENKKKKSKRNRSHPRTLTTYKNKTRKLQSEYNRLFRTSQKSKEEYLALPEEQRKIIDIRKSQKREGVKPYFCDKYPTFDKFLEKNQLKRVGKEKEQSYTSSPTVSKSQLKKKGIWGM